MCSSGASAVSGIPSRAEVATGAARKLPVQVLLVTVSTTGPRTRIQSLAVECHTHESGRDSELLALAVKVQYIIMYY